MSAKKRGLGRGFSSLIPDDILDESFDPTAIEDERISDLRQIKISQVFPDPDQPRRNFDQEALDRLAISIGEHGVLQPIVVIPRGDKYMIVAGERRWRAANIAKLDKIPALVRTLSDQHKLELSLIENIQRSDLNPIETATAYLKLRDQFNVSLDVIAKRMGAKSVSTVSNKMRLLKLPKSVQKKLASGDIKEGQIRPLIGLDESVVVDITNKIIKEGWSARKVEQLIVAMKKQQPKETPEPKKRVETAAAVYNKQIENISNKLGTKVKIRSNSKGSGMISIAFKNAEDLERIESMLTS